MSRFIAHNATCADCQSFFGKFSQVQLKSVENTSEYRLIS